MGMFTPTPGVRSKTGLFHNLRVYACFTLLFGIAAVGVFIPYYLDGRSLIANADAVLQHYPALTYYGTYLRQTLEQILTGQWQAISTWDMSLGYGADIITTLHYYCLGDPLALLSVFFSPARTELLYELLIILRLYVSGLAMVVFCKYHKCEDYTALAGALIYAFSGYAIAPGVYHPFFTIPMMYLPLILMGIDKIYSRTGPVLYIAAIALAALSNFYFFYMLVILAVLYAAMRYFHFHQRFRLTECLSWLGRFVFYALIGVLLAAPVLLPNVVSMIQSDRLSVVRDIPLLYPAEYYLWMPAAMVTNYGRDYLYVAVSGVAMIAVFTLLLSRSKEATRWRLSLITLVLFAALPFCGSVFNGFNYVTNRWIWALSFVLGYAVAAFLPKAEAFSSKQLWCVAAMTTVFGILCLLPSEARVAQTYTAIAVMLLCLLLVFLHLRKRLRRAVYRTAIIALTVISVVCNGYYWASPEANNWAGSSMLSGLSHAIYASSPANTVAALPDAAVTRFDQSVNIMRYNSALYPGVNGTSYYYSTLDPGTVSFQRSQMLNSPMGQQYHGLNGRSYLAAALSVSYFLAQEGVAQPIPYGYDVPVEEGAATIYTSEDTLPLVYAFDTVCREAQALTVTQRQQALLQCAMTAQPCDLPEAELRFTDHPLDCQILAADGVTVLDDRLSVSKEGATLTVSFPPVYEEELYVIVKGLDHLADTALTEVRITLQAGDVSQTLHLKTATDNYYCGYHDFLVNLGHSAGQAGELTVTFPSVGEYVFSEATVVAQPMAEFPAQVRALADSGISDIAVEGGVISFSSERSGAGVACVAVPYKQGWAATVDGVPTSVFSVQDGLCGILLPEGHHRVVLTYRTPYLRFGWLLALIGVTLLVTVCVLRRHRVRFPRRAGA